MSTLALLTIGLLVGIRAQEMIPSELVQVFLLKAIDFAITDQEIVDFANKLRADDENRAKPGQIILDYQGHTSTRDGSDNAPGKFFKKVDSALLRKPTYEQFIKLTDNYDRRTGQPEPLIPAAQEKAEVSEFLTTVLNTKAWKDLYEFLQRKGISTLFEVAIKTSLEGHPFARDPTTFRFWIAQLWFVHYSRARGVADTSGFEHVFMGEVKNGEISGMHNWLRFYLLERNTTQSFDYKGFLNIMAALKFQWFGELKRSGSILLGTSPEFDMALYTLCFLSRRGRQTCEVELDGCPLSVTSYEINQNRKVFIGSIYPSAGRITDQCRRLNG